MNDVDFDRHPAPRHRIHWGRRIALAILTVVAGFNAFVLYDNSVRVLADAASAPRYWEYTNALILSLIRNLDAPIFVVLFLVLYPDWGRTSRKIRYAMKICRSIALCEIVTVAILVPTYLVIRPFAITVWSQEIIWVVYPLLYAVVAPMYGVIRAKKQWDE